MSTTKEKLIKTSLDIFSQKGYLATSMSEISSVMGLTKGGIYHHINKKEDLLVLIHNQMADGYLKRIDKIISSNEDKVSTLKKWIKVHLETIHDYLPNLKVFFKEYSEIKDKEQGREVLKKRRKIFAILHDLIESGIQAKQFRADLDPIITAMLILGMLNWLYMWYRVDGRLTIDDIYNQVETFVFDGILR